MPSRGTLTIEGFHDINTIAVEPPYRNQPPLVGWQADQSEVALLGRHPRQGRPAASRREITLTELALLRQWWEALQGWGSTNLFDVVSKASHVLRYPDPL